MLDARDAVSVIEALLKHARTLLNCISHSGSPSLSPILLHLFHLFFSVSFSCSSPSLSHVLLHRRLHSGDLDRARGAGTGLARMSLFASSWDLGLEISSDVGAAIGADATWRRN